MTEEARQGTCEYLRHRAREPCGAPAVWRYPAMGGGFMRLCDRHGAAHARYADHWTAEGWQRAKGQT